MFQMAMTVGEWPVTICDLSKGSWDQTQYLSRVFNWNSSRLFLWYKKAIQTHTIIIKKRILPYSDLSCSDRATSISMCFQCLFFTVVCHTWKKKEKKQLPSQSVWNVVERNYGMFLFLFFTCTTIVMNVFCCVASSIIIWEINIILCPKIKNKMHSHIKLVRCSPHLFQLWLIFFPHSSMRR